MKRMFCYCLAVFAVLGLTPCAFADTVGGSGSFLAWPLGVPSQGGSVYWDNTSQDVGQKNIGYYLTNTGAFSGGTGPGVAFPYWGIGGGLADLNFYFNNTNGSRQTAMQIEVAGNDALNTFGYYDTVGIYQLFTGPQTAGASTTFSPVGNYGFYIGTPTGNYYTQSSMNPAADQQFQHFALFQQSADNYWIGMEDLPFLDSLGNKVSDKDYNDMVVTVRPVPIPAAVWLLGSGLLGLAGIRRRFRK
jgi:hypothetical protein